MNDAFGAANKVAQPVAAASRWLGEIAYCLGAGALGVGGLPAIPMRCPELPAALEALPDFGTMGLVVLGEPADETSPAATVPFPEKLSDSLG